MSRFPLALVFSGLFVLWTVAVCAEQPAVVAIRALTDPVKIATLKDPRACNDRLLKCMYWLSNSQTGGHAPAAVL